MGCGLVDTKEKTIKLNEHDAIVLYDLLNFVFWSKKKHLLISDFFLDLEIASGLPRDYTKKEYRRLRRKLKRTIPDKLLNRVK